MPKVSSASTSAARMIWIAVFALETSRGFISTGWPITDDSTTAQMISPSRETTATTSHSGSWLTRPRTTKTETSKSLSAIGSR